MKQKLLATTMLAGSSVLLCSAIASQGGEKSRLAANLEAGKKQIVVTYGTSLTAGGAWVGQLSAELNRRYPALATVINSGQNAMWSKWGVDNLQACVLDKQPDTVFIEFSINDAHLPYATSVAQARSNLVNMVDRILAANKSCEIILMVMNAVTLSHLINLTNRPQLDTYNQMYRDVATDRHLLLIDHYSNWEKILKDDPKLFSKYVPDGLHPNAEGCKAVITPQILNALGIGTDDKGK